MAERVLVTGGSGFIAGHCIQQLLEAGHEVRTTVRSLSREAAVRTVLADAGVSDDRDLSFAAADLTSDAGWAEALHGIDVVLHVASPVRPGHVENEDDLIVPAREGALRVLRAASGAGVNRVVLTSAFHAVGWGHPHTDHVFTEDDWTVLDGPGTDAYGRSKTLSEWAAWEFIEREGGSLELVTMLPVAVMGPVMGNSITGSNEIIQRMLTGGMPVLPNLYLPIVDVRDVARAHLLAMKPPEAAGQRFLLSSGPAIPLAEIAATIRRQLGDKAAKVPTRKVPDLLFRLAGLTNPEFRGMASDLGYVKQTSSAKARELLGWVPRDPHEAVIAAAESLVAKGLVT